jgi:hypothetical protein
MTQLSPDESARFRALVKPAIVLLLMLRLDRPIGAHELAAILGIDEHTISRYLRMLSGQNLVVRTSYHKGYSLLGGRQLILGTDANVKNLHFAAATTSTTLMEESEGDEEAVVEESARNVKNLHFGTVDPSRPGKQTPELDTVTRALLEAGIGEPKRSSLARLTHVTPTCIKAWEMQLKKDKGDRYSTGLLIHVLESGDPHPPVNENGHLLNCKCAECKRLEYGRCWYCGKSPCECGEDG